MSADLFETLDSAGFGSNVCEVASQGDCRVLRLEDKTGEGFMTMYRIFDGVYLMYNDFHLQSCISQYQNADTVLCIDHCREGRIEHENALHEHYYMESGNIRIDKRVHHEGKVVLPLSHYHGITIGFVSGAAEQSLKREMAFLPCDLKALAEKFCPQNKELLIRANDQLGSVFAQLYHAPQNVKLDYFRVKTAELLLLLSTADIEKQAHQHQYFPTKQTEKIKQIHSLMTSSLESTFTIEQLSERFDMPSATLRKVFKAVYGAPIYQYIKAYKMKAAASMLISQNDLNISEISQRLGYDNASKFSAAFRDVIGDTPQNYRKRQEEI